MNDVITDAHADSAGIESVSHDPSAGDGATFDTPPLGAPGPAAPPRKRHHALALAWWTACTLWAYFVFGELVVTAAYPEAMAVLGVVAGFAAAGRRVKEYFDDFKSALLGAVITALLGTVFAIVGPAVLSAFVPRQSIALLALLLTAIVAFVALWMMRRREREQTQQPPSKYLVARIIAWLIVLIVTTVAVVLAAN